MDPEEKKELDYWNTALEEAAKLVDLQIEEDLHFDGGHESTETKKLKTLTKGIRNLKEQEHAGPIETT